MRPCLSIVRQRLYLPEARRSIAHPAGRLPVGPAFELVFKLFDNLFPVLSLPFGLTGIVAHDIPTPKRSIAGDHFLCRAVCLRLFEFL